MVFTRQQLDRLAPYEKNMRTAVLSDWSGGLGRRGIREMKAVWEEHTGRPYTLNESCSRCIMKLLKMVGSRYFQDIEEQAREQAAHDAEMIEKAKQAATGGFSRRSITFGKV